MMSDADDDAPSASGSELSSAGASPPAQGQACRGDIRPGWRPPSPDDLLEMARLADADQDDRGQCSGERGRAECADANESSSSKEASSAGQSCAELGSAQPADQLEDAVQSVTKATLAARATAVFDTSAGWPTEVRKPLLAPLVTNQVVRDAVLVCDDLCDRDGKALSAAFGNFDRRVAIGWLLADAAGMPLRTRPQAHALGIKAQRADGAAKAAIREARKRAIAPARAAGADIGQAQDEAEAAVLCANAEIVAQQQSPAKCPAGSASSGSRKRAREHEPSSLELLDAQLAEAEGASLQARKAVLRAETAEDTASTAEDAAWLRLMRLVTAVKQCKGKKRPSSKLLHVLHGRARRAENAWHEAQIATKNAQIAYLVASLDSRDAMIDMLLLDQERGELSFKESI